ncbi:CHASE domain-containing protein, partial [Massilia sp.]|uniref:CHASE domain-containing protein n=1 Tax=Massilia sp. TaxID=1882437 RepID=UPI00352FDD18
MLSTLVGSMLYVVTSRSIESDVQERFSRQAKYAQAVISMRIKSYTDLLHGAASLLQSGDTISHRQFHDYVQGLHLARNYPAVDTLNFATWVRDDERPQFEAEFARELQAFLGPGAHPVVTPSGRRPAYLVVTYIEPDATNTRLYG